MMPSLFHMGNVYFASVSPNKLRPHVFQHNHFLGLDRVYFIEYSNAAVLFCLSLVMVELRRSGIDFLSFVNVLKTYQLLFTEHSFENHIVVPPSLQSDVLPG